MLNCPRCQGSAIPLWRKCLLSPDASFPCGSCGASLGVPRFAIAAAIPLAGGIIGLIRLPLPWSLAAALAAFLVYVGLQRFVVPLVLRPAD